MVELPKEAVSLLWVNDARVLERLGSIRLKRHQDERSPARLEDMVEFTYSLAVIWNVFQDMRT